MVRACAATPSLLRCEAMDQQWKSPGARRLRLWAVGLPLALLVLLELLRVLLLDAWLGPGRASAVAAGLLVLGVLVFSLVLWRQVELTEGEMSAAYAAVRGHERLLVALHEAALSVTSALELSPLLQRVVDRSRSVLGSRYGAVAVVGPDGAIQQFVTSGLDAATVRRLGAPPTGHGLLGLVIAERRPLLVDGISAHPNSVGFPPGHPPMRTLVAVPLLYQHEILGSLYVADREDGRPFTPQDRETLERFAAQVAIAVANARLYGEVQRLSLLEERERISMDLHDGVLQSLYATALGLETAALDIETDPAAARGAVALAVQRLHATIGDIRHYIFDLRSAEQDGRSLPALLHQLVEGLRHPGVDIALDAAADLPELPRRVQWEAWHIAREALSNALRHAGCRRLTCVLAVRDGVLLLRVHDDGRGFDPARPVENGHRGLANMRRRAEAVGGSLEITAGTGRGSTVELRVPLSGEGGASE